MKNVSTICDCGGTKRQGSASLVFHQYKLTVHGIDAPICKLCGQPTFAAAAIEDIEYHLQRHTPAKTTPKTHPI